MVKSSSSSDQHFDAIVIGSGIGGMTVASLLAQVDRKRVLVLERHFKLGGFTHSFRRGNYEWDPGVHYVGEMRSGALARRIMDLATQRGVQWKRLGSTVERVFLPGIQFEINDNPQQYLQRLVEKFPEEEDNIRRYFRDMKRAQAWLARWYASKTMPSLLGRLLLLPGQRLASMNTAHYMQRFQSEELRAILTAQWPDYGTLPSESAFGFHATVAADYLHGSYFPIGGGSRLSEHMAKAVEQYGGRCLVSNEVKRIHVENNRATGVTVLRKGQEYTYWSDVVVSNAGVKTTFEKLLPENAGSPEREKARQLKAGPSALILFLGLKSDPRELGFDDANYWLFDTFHHAAQGVVAEGDDVVIKGAFVTFGSLRNPSQTHHTAQVITFTDDSAWQKFAGSKWKKRGETYENQKERMADMMLTYAERYLPGLRNMVDYSELATPLSIESFTGHAHGQIYGQACDSNRLFDHAWKCTTSVKGLFLSGSDIGTPGVNGALMAGAMTAAKIMGALGVPRILAKAKKY